MGSFATRPTQMQRQGPQPTFAPSGPPVTFAKVRHCVANWFRLPSPSTVVPALSHVPWGQVSWSGCEPFWDFGQWRLTLRLHSLGLNRIYSQGPSHPDLLLPTLGEEGYQGSPPMSRLTPLVSGLKDAGSESYFHMTH